MKAPVKIYINTLNIDKGDNHWFIDKEDNPADKKYNVEYLRKDALIGWAKGHLKAKKTVGLSWRALIEKVKST